MKLANIFNGHLVVKFKKKHYPELKQAGVVSGQQLVRSDEHNVIELSSTIVG